MWRNFKRFFNDSGAAGSAALFMLLCVIVPTVILQGAFTFIAMWEVLLMVLLFLSLRTTSEDE